MLRIRQAIAFLLLAGAAVPAAWISYDLAFSRETYGVGLSLGVLALLLKVSALGVVVPIWWARLVAFAWALVVAIPGALMLPVLLLPGGALLLYATILCLSLAGPGMFQRFEGAAPPPMTWSRPGMTVVRAALITNVTGLMAIAALFLPWRIDCLAYDCSAQLPALVPFVSLAALTVAGVILLARQKTAGLLLLVLGVSGVLLQLILRAPTGFGVTLLCYLAPGMVCALAALLRYLPRMVRFLRA